MKTTTLFLSIALATLTSSFGCASSTDSTNASRKKIKTIEIIDGETIVTDSIFNYDGNDIDYFRGRGMHSRKGNIAEGQNMNRRGGQGMRSNNENNETKMVINENGDSIKVIVSKRPCRNIDNNSEFGPRFKQNNPDRNQCNNSQRRGTFRNGNHSRNQKQEGNIQDGKRRLQNNRMLNLNDANIISFNREVLKNGEEKITIIRKKS